MKIKCNTRCLVFLIFLPIIIASTLLPTFAYCSENTPEESNGSITFRIYSFMPEFKVMEKYTPIVGYLNYLLNKEVKLSISSDPNDFIDKIGSGRFDLAFINAVNYTKLMNKYAKREIIAILALNDNPYFFENIVVDKDSPYYRIEDLNKKDIKFAFSKDQSKSIIQEAMLLEGGVKKQYLENRNYYMPKFAYKEMVSALNNKECDAGCLDDYLLNKYVNDLRSVSKSGPIPAPMIIVNDSLPTETVNELKKAISDLHNHDDGKLILFQINSAYDRFQVPENINFDYLQRILRKDGDISEPAKIGQGILPWEKNNGCPPFFLRDDEGQVINPIDGLNSNKPYSTRQTCGFCHDYQKISQGFHFQMGMNEREGFDNTKSPWKITPGMTGGW